MNFSTRNENQKDKLTGTAPDYQIILQGLKAFRQRERLNVVMIAKQHAIIRAGL